MSNFKAFVAQKCPRCRKGSMFSHNWYHVTKFAATYSHCPVCNLKFEIEPSFFTGAMYFSYAINVAVMVIVGVTLNLCTDWPIERIVIAVIGISLALVPINFRFSRLLMMYLFSGVTYDFKFENKQ